MPNRKIPLVTEEIYHVFNRGIEERPTFTDRREYQRAIKTIMFYRSVSPPVKLSRFLSIALEERLKIIKKQKEMNQRLVEIISFCLMPNHFHFLLKQAIDGGISHFIGQFQNSFTRYFNTKHDRVGPLFLDQFKAVRIETDRQLLHVSRYVHLNPYSSFVVKNVEELETYPWSSFPEYLRKEESEEICSKELILSFFNNISEYKEFIFDQADYQKALQAIKHLTIETY